MRRMPSGLHDGGVDLLDALQLCVCVFAGAVDWVIGACLLLTACVLWTFVRLYA